MQQLLGWNMYLCVVIILAIVAVYTVIGKDYVPSDAQCKLYIQVVKLIRL